MTALDERQADGLPAEELTGLGLLQRALAEQEAADPRALQVETGASQALGCRAESLFRLLGVPESDARLRLDALIGKAAHAYVEKALEGLPGLLVEHRAVYRDVPCTIDLGYISAGRVVDWKFPRLSKIARLKKDGIGKGYRAQVHLAGAALREAGYDIHTVGLVFAPRDGDIDDAWEFSEPFDQAIADAAADRVEAEAKRARRIRKELQGQHDPEQVNAAILAEIRREGLRDEDLFFCRTYCAHGTNCRGPEPEAPEPPDDGVLEAAQQVAAAWVQKQEADLLLKEWKPQIAAYERLAIEGYKLAWAGGNPKVNREVDLPTVFAAYEAIVGELPMVETEGTTPRYLRVTPVRSKGAPRG